MIMELILCNTNLAVPTVACQIALNPQKRFAVFTDIQNIHDFFSVIKFPNVELFYFQSNFTLYKLGKLLRTRKEVKTIIRERNIEHLYYYHQAFGGFFNWIIAYCSKWCDITYYRLIGDLQCPRAKCSFTSIKIKWIYKIIYSTDVNVIDRGNNNLIPKLANVFYEKYRITESNYSIDNNVISALAKKLLSKLSIDTERSIILLTGSVLDTAQVDSDEYMTKTKIILDAIGRKNVLAKCHPRFNDEIEEERALPHVPSFIPMEFLIEYFDVFIGYNSTVLINASKRGKTAISLIDYFMPVSDERKQNWHSYFTGSEVMFPNNISEITNLINKI